MIRKLRVFATLLLTTFVAGAAPGEATTQSESIPASSIPIQVTTPNPGLLSFGLYNDQGTLIRSIAAAKPVEKGALQLSWDGTSDLGLPVSPGTYHARGVWFAQPPKANYVMKVGESGDPPWVTADGLGGWGGNLGAPEDLCCNGKEIVEVFQCVESALITGIQRMDASGKISGRYFSFLPWDVRLACTMDQTHFYLAAAYFSGKRLIIGKYDIGQPKGKILLDIPAGNHVEADGRWKDRWTADVRGIAAINDRLFVPVLLDDKLFVVDAVNGKILATKEISSPRGVVSHGGAVFLLSKTRLLKLDLDGNTIGSIIESGLEDPSGVACDQAGNFYITDRGNSQQVRIFSPDGKLLRTIGVKGGRPRDGLYNKAGMLDPRGLCVGPDGAVWVAEYNEDFQRTSVWEPQSGALRQEYFTTRISADQGQLTPDRHQMFFTHDVYADAPGVEAYNLDWDKGTWSPAWHQTLPTKSTSAPDVLVGNNHLFGQVAVAYGNHAPYLSFAGGMLKADNGKTYCYGGDFSIWLFDEQTAAPKLAALVYMHRAHRTPDGKFAGDYDQGSKSWLAWSDVNGDGQMSVPEVRMTEIPPGMDNVSRPFGFELQPDLSILMLCPETHGRDLTHDWVIKRLAPRSISPEGVPTYDWADVKDVTHLQVPSYVGGDGWKGGKISTLTGLNTAGGAFNVFNEGRPGQGVKLRMPGIDGDGWWASRNWRNSPMRFDASGKPSWVKLGRRAPGKALPGEMYYPHNISADIDGFCFVGDEYAQSWVWTDTGLYVGRLYHDMYEQIHDDRGVFIESGAAFAFKVNGKIYSCIGDQGVFVHQLDMPKLTPIDGGTVTVTPTIAAAAKPWDPDGPMPGKRPVFFAKTIWDFNAETENARKGGDRTKSFHIATIKIDGKLDDPAWARVEPMVIHQDGKIVANVKVLFDRKTLYLAYDVIDPNGLKNAGTEVPLCPFTSGSYIDFCIGRDWTNPDRDTNLEGDVRVIMARINGAKTEDFQIGYYPVRSPKHAKFPQTIVSPAAQRHFDDVSPVQDLQWAYEVNDHGYTVEVSVPMNKGRTALGLYPTQNIGFDVSVGFANDAGTVRRSAAHWDGQSESQVVDRPGSAALQPDTWGTLVFDRSLPAKDSISTK